MLLWKLFQMAVGEGFDVAACLPLAEHVACDGFVLVVLQADAGGIVLAERAFAVGGNLFELLSFRRGSLQK